jgi:RNA polymerase sigma factor FliA
VTAQGVAHARTTPVPMSPHEAQLWVEFINTRSAEVREKLFVVYLPLARQLAGRHFKIIHAGTIEFAELVQMATTGLLEAIDRFDPALGVPFRYFGNRRISGSILNGIAAYNEVNRQISAKNRLTADRMASLARNVGSPDGLIQKLDILSEIAAGLAVGLMLAETHLVASPEAPSNENGYETLAWKQTTEKLVAELSKLPTREQDIIRLHYQDGMPFDQLSQIFGITKGRVSQLHRAAISLLRKRLLNDGFSFRG